MCMKNLSLTSLLIIFLFSIVADAQIEKVNGMTFVKREYKESRKSNSGIEIQVEYPELIDAGKTVETFNQMVRALVMNKVAVAKKGFDLIEGELGLSKESRQFYSFLMSHSVEFANKDYISVRFNYYQGRAALEDGEISIEEDQGRAVNLSYNLKQQKLLNISDLFRAGSKYQAFFSKWIAARRRVKEGGGQKDAAVPVVLETGSYQFWNLSNEGVVLNIERRMEGYIETIPEVTIRYQGFPPSIKSATFRNIQAFVKKGARQSSICRFEDTDFDPDSEVEVEYQIGKVKGGRNSRAYIYECDIDLPDQNPRRSRKYLISGDEALVLEVVGDFAQISYPVKNKWVIYGWILISKLNIQPVNQNPSISDWLGNWKYGDDIASLEIKRGDGPNSLLISGGAIYRYGPKADAEKNGSINFGNIGEDEENGKGEVVKPKRNRFLLAPKGYPDCKIHAQLVGKFMVVSDNYKCGGRNVTYDGIYRRKK